jgi:hypothetical protein
MSKKKTYVFYKGNMILAPSKGVPYHAESKTAAICMLPKLREEFGGFQTKYPIKIKSLLEQDLYKGWPK